MPSPSLCVSACGLPGQKSHQSLLYFSIDLNCDKYPFPFLEKEMRVEVSETKQSKTVSEIIQ